LGCFFKGVLGKAVEIGWVFVVSLWSFCGEAVVPCVMFLGIEKNVTFFRFIFGDSLNGKRLRECPEPLRFGWVATG
jgi:hypothetical protein